MLCTPTPQEEGRPTLAQDIFHKDTCPSFQQSLPHPPRWPWNLFMYSLITTPKLLFLIIVFFLTEAKKSKELSLISFLLYINDTTFTFTIVFHSYTIMSKWLGFTPYDDTVYKNQKVRFCFADFVHSKIQEIKKCLSWKHLNFTNEQYYIYEVSIKHSSKNLWNYH